MFIGMSASRFNIETTTLAKMDTVRAFYKDAPNTIKLVAPPGEVDDVEKPPMGFLTIPPWTKPDFTRDIYPYSRLQWLTKETSIRKKEEKTSLKTTINWL